MVSAFELRIRTIVDLNMALQAQWLWIFLKEDNRLWRKIVWTRWGDLNWDNSGRTRIGRPHGTSLWRKISMQWPQFLDNLQWKVGRDNKIRFWKDVWIENYCLMRRFPRIFAIAQAQNMLVQDAYRNNNISVEWLINVIRNLQD